MRIICIIFVLSFVSLSAKSDTGKNLEAINNILQKHAVVAGDFIQTRSITGIDQPLVSRGDFIFVKLKGIYWHTVEPVEFDTRFLHPEFTGSQQPQQPKPGLMQKRIGQLMMNFLGGDIKSLEKRFHLALADKEGVWKLSLDPKRKAVKKQLSLLTIEGADYINEISIINNKSGTTTIKFSNIQQRDKPNTQECALISTHLGPSDDCT